LTDRQGALALAVLACAVAALYLSREVGAGWISAVVFLTGSILFCVAVLLASASIRAQRLQVLARRAVRDMLQHDPAASYLADATGMIILRNPAARDRVGDARADRMDQALADLMANPAGVMARLMDRLDATGLAREDVVTRRGHLKLSVQRLDSGDLLWRVERVGDVAVPRGADTVALPMLTVSPSGTVLFMNDAARRLIGQRIRTLDALSSQGPVTGGQVVDVDALDGPVSCLVAEVPAQAGRREIYLLPAAAAHPSARRPRDGRLWNGCRSRS
jgi:two-component system, cell cycle sensor histidine kinase and response regulator CckA